MGIGFELFEDIEICYKVPKDKEKEKGKNPKLHQLHPLPPARPTSIAALSPCSGGGSDSQVGRMTGDICKGVIQLDLPAGVL